MEGRCFIRINLPLLLITFSLGVSACQTTSTSDLNKWQKISHQNSDITIISDNFSAGTVHLKEKLDIKMESVQLLRGAKVVGKAYVEIVTGMNYCGFTTTALDKVFKKDGFIKKYVNLSGASNNTKSKLFRSKHGPASYVDLKGGNGRCVVSAQIRGRTSGVNCLGNTILILAVCGSSYEERENLDRQVLALVNAIRVDGTGKDLIKEASIPSTSQQPSSSNSIKAKKDQAKLQGNGNIEDRLAKLKILLSQGLLTSDEAAAKRKEILEGL